MAEDVPVPDVELWDLTDACGHRTGDVVRRDAPEWPEGLFHLVVATCVVRADGRLLMTRRAATKDYPLRWELPGGSVLAGESGRRAAARELREETGIVAAEESLELVGRFAESTALVDLYVTAVSDEPVLALEPNEVHEADWVPLSEAEQRHAASRMAEPWAARLDALWPDLRAAVRSAWARTCSPPP